MHFGVLSIIDFLTENSDRRVNWFVTRQFVSRDLSLLQITKTPPSQVPWGTE